MAFIVHHDGTQTIFPDDALLVFVDETGDEKFLDPNVPYFGFGGCMCRARDYSDFIVTPWRTVEQNFDTVELPLHAANLRTPTADQIDALSEFFQSGRFWRFAVLIKKGAVNETPHDAFHIAAKTTLDHILHLIKKSGEDFTHIVMLFEHSQRLDRSYADYFRRYSFSRKDGQKVPVFHATQEKALGADFAPGLVVADFVAHTAGSMSRSSGGGTRKVIRRDFNAIFQNERASHLFVDAIREP